MIVLAGAEMTIGGSTGSLFGSSSLNESTIDSSGSLPSLYSLRIWSLWSLIYYSLKSEGIGLWLNLQLFPSWQMRSIWKKRQG